MKSSTDRRTYTHTVGGFQVCRSARFQFQMRPDRLGCVAFVCLSVCKWGKKVVRYQMKGDEDSRCFYVSISIIQTIKRIFSLKFIWMDLMKIPRRLVYFFFLELFRCCLSSTHDLTRKQLFQKEGCVKKKKRRNWQRERREMLFKMLPQILF